MSPRALTHSLRGGKLTRKLFLRIMWVIFRKLGHNFVRQLKGIGLFLSWHTAAAKVCLVVYRRRGGFASTTGTQDLGVGMKVLLKIKSQEDGILSRCKKHLSMSIMFF